MSDALLLQVLARVQSEGMGWLSQVLPPAVETHQPHISPPVAGQDSGLRGRPVRRTRPPARLLASISPPRGSRVRPSGASGGGQGYISPLPASSSQGGLHPPVLLPAAVVSSSQGGVDVVSTPPAAAPLFPRSLPAAGPVSDRPARPPVLPMASPCGVTGLPCPERRAGTSVRARAGRLCGRLPLLALPRYCL